MAEQMISARVELNDYTNKVLGIIKIKFGFKDKSQAINKFIELFGENILEKEATDEYVSKMILLVKKHFEKYANEKMSVDELDKLCEV